LAGPEIWQTLLVALCLTLFFLRLGARPIWDIDEGKQAVTSMEMVRSGDWIAPTFNGEPFLTNRCCLIGWGTLIFLAVASLRYILISLKNPGYAEYFFVYQNLGNFGSPDPRHPAPFYYYIPVLLGGFFPWSCFLPLAFIHALRKHFQTASGATAFLVIWICGVFIFFSIALVVMVVTTLHLFMLMIVPSVNPYRSNRELALQYDRLLPPGAKFTFYRRINESALFYTGRGANVIRNPDQYVTKIMRPEVAALLLGQF
jgi:4-amino-4-deoxy-L-arabinose transferase-like glycosyltransferase